MIDSNASRQASPVRSTHNGKPSALPRSSRAHRAAGEARRLRTLAGLLFAVLLVTLAHGVQAGINVWTSHGPPGPVSALAIDPVMPSTLYAGTLGAGVFKSMDGGATWRGTGLTNGTVFALAIDPTTSTTLYAAMGYAGVFTSTDGGVTWSARGLGKAI